MPSDCTSVPSPSEAPSPVSGASAQELLTVIHDLQAQLLACQRLALLGSMVAMVVHEFNNLLTPIVARAEAALLNPADVSYMQKTVERALVQGQRAMAVMAHLLDLARDGERPVAACGVADVVREAIATMTRPLDKDGIELRLSVPEHLRVLARDQLLCQVLLNLLLNARDAMKGHAGSLSISATACDDQVQLDIRDSGRGIPQEQLDRVINPFLAAEPGSDAGDWHQVGLGLNVCRLIARHHGATLCGLANAEGGCTFRLRWPAATPGSARTNNC